MNHQRSLKVFLCYADDDKDAVHDLYQRLIGEGMDVWFREESLFPGQDRDLEVRRAVRSADAAIICLSHRFDDAGYQQWEVRLILDLALRQPQGEIFIIPAFLESYGVPESLEAFESVDLFTAGGYERLFQALQLDAQPRPGPDVANENEAGRRTRSRRNRNLKEKPKTFLRLLLNLKKFRVLLDIKFLGLLLAAIVLLFGNNIYQQVTGRSIFAEPATPTVVVTMTSTSAATATETLTPTNTSTPDPTSTFTPVPATGTPTTTPTLTAVPPVALGADWLAGCISTLWRAYPATVPMTDRGNGCWAEPLYVFSAENGDLDFLAQRKTTSLETYGLFALLPERGKVSFTIRLRALNHVELWMGIFTAPDVASDGFLMVIPEGDVKRRVFVKRDVHTQERELTTVPLDQGNGYLLSFTFDTLSVSSQVGPNTLVTKPMSLPSEQKWIFIGYRGLPGSYHIDGTFLQFELKP